MPKIHPSSVIEPGAELAETVEIGPFCHVGSKVRLGPGTRLVSHVAVRGRTTIGAHNQFWPQATVGADPQDLKFHGEDSELIIGDHNVIRESVTLHLGTANGGGVTRVGSHNLIMVGAHIAHDCIVGDHVIMANNVGLAGHVRVEDHANIGGFVGCHHFVTIGRYSFVGGMARLVKDVPPFMIVEGMPARVRDVNKIGLTRFGFSETAIENLKDAFRRLFRRSDDTPLTNTAEGLVELERDYPGDEAIAYLINFIRNSTAGVHGRFQESQRSDAKRYRRGGPEKDRDGAKDDRADRPGPEQPGAGGRGKHS